MNVKEYEVQFELFGLEVKPLPGNYTPDSFAQLLMRDFPQKPAITYSAATNYEEKKDNDNRK